ncbi:MAG TPA: HAD-IIIA family hydrolase [Pseudonocardiaceae bacterium]
MSVCSRPLETVFLDRDGTINVPAAQGDYIRTPDRLVLLPGAAAAIRQFNRAGLRVVLVTNQRWMSAPDADPASFGATQDRLRELLAAEGAWLDAAYHCPHALRSCRCRKPAPGMLWRAAEDLGLDLTRSVIVGDAVSDLQAGRAAGTGTILLSAVGVPSLLADVTCPDLPAAVELLLDASGAAPPPRSGSARR